MSVIVCCYTVMNEMIAVEMLVNRDVIEQKSLRRLPKTIAAS